MNSPRRWLLVVFGAVVLAFPFVSRRLLPPKAPLPPPSAAVRKEAERPGAPPTPPPTPVPLDPLRNWASAIQRRDEKAVLNSQSVFLSREEEYREPLIKMSKEDGDPRVRAFSIAVLGRMKAPPPETFFLERLGDPYEYPRTSALQALQRLGSAACLTKLDGLAASDPAEAVRAAAAQAAKAVRSR
jgi:hypothetical protein